VIAIVTGALGVIQTLLSNQVGQRVMHDLRAAVFRHLQRLSLAFFTRTRTGEVQSRISNDIGGVQNVVTNTATSIASNVTTVVATMIGMLVLSWQLALFAFALIPLFAFLTRRVGNERRRIAKTTQETLADISSIVQESLSVSGILLGKTMGRGDELADRFEEDSRKLADLEVRQRMAGRWVMASIQTSFAVMPAAVYWVGGLLLASGSHAVSIPMLVAFTTLQTRLFFPVGSLLGVGLDVQTSLALFDRIFEYLDEPIDIEEKPDAITAARAGDVVFDHVWFRYDEEWTLRDASFTVPAGTTTAIVGETGSGKTTLGYLAARLYDVDRGRVAIGDVDVRDLSFEALTNLVGVVSQETYLFHASVRENLSFAKPDATDDELEAAAKAARIHDVIAALPQGYDTVVGERGYRFSGGEKQRIAIARTILRNPPILVLDEATSALDNETERLVQDALDRLAAGKDDDHDRSPALDHPRRRADRGARARPHRRARPPRRADAARRALRGSRGARRAARRAARLGRVQSLDRERATALEALDPVAASGHALRAGVGRVAVRAELDGERLGCRADGERRSRRSRRLRSPHAAQDAASTGSPSDSCFKTTY
jgi:ATP-binding cassette subfamily B protein